VEFDANMGVSEAVLQLSEAGVLKGQWQVHKEKKSTDRSWSLELNKRIVSQGQLRKNTDTGSSVSLQAQLPEGGFFSGQVSLEADKLTFDDIYYLAGRVPKGFRLLVVDGEGGMAPSESEVYYLRLALESPRDPRLERIHTIRPEILSQENLEQYDAIVLANVGNLSSLESKLIRWIEAGGGLFLTAGGNWPKAPTVPLNLFRSKPNVERDFKVAPPKEAAFFLKSVAGLDRFEWSEIQVYQHRPLIEDSSWESLLTLEGGNPLLVKKKLGKGYVICLLTTLDRRWTNLPAKPIFSPMVRELVASLADPLREQTTLNGYVDEPFRVRMPLEIRNVTVISPNGTSAGASVSPDGYLEWQSPSLPGLYHVKTNSNKHNFSFAINIRAQEEEGSLTRLKNDKFKKIFPKASVNWVSHGGKSIGSVLAALQGKDLTTFLILLLILLFLCETFLAWPDRRKEWSN